MEKLDRDVQAMAAQYRLSRESRWILCMNEDGPNMIHYHKHHHSIASNEKDLQTALQQYLKEGWFISFQKCKGGFRNDHPPRFILFRSKGLETSHLTLGI